MADRDLTRFGWFSIGAALVTLGLKLVAWLLTGSVGLLSDALESTVNLAAAVLMLVALRVSALPPDDNHHYGHEKAELFSAAAEGLMIVAAASLIIWRALDRLLHPQELSRVGLGLAVSVVAGVINLAVGLVLVRGGRRHDSGALLADGRHLLTDVWTTAGVIVGVVLVQATGMWRLDPILAIAVALHILWTGSKLVSRSFHGLMDVAVPASDLAVIVEVLEKVKAHGGDYHALRSRESGARSFVDVHILVPGRLSVQAGHDLCESLEREIQSRLPHVEVLTHLEPIEDPRSWDDPENPLAGS